MTLGVSWDRLWLFQFLRFSKDTETWHCRLSSCPTSPPEGRAAVALLWAPDLASAEGWRLLSAGLQQEIVEWDLEAWTAGD